MGKGLLLMSVGALELVIMAPLVLFMFYSLFHAATNMKIPGLNRLIWALVILGLPVMGAIAYWVIGREARNK